MIIINPTQEPTKIVHIAWFPGNTNDPDNITLCELVQEIYPHPDAPNTAVLTRLDIKNHGTYSRRDIMSAPLILLEAAQNNIQHF